jgi:hypothetical protein
MPGKLFVSVPISYEETQIANKKLALFAEKEDLGLNANPSKFCPTKCVRCNKAVYFVDQVY